MELRAQYEKYSNCLKDRESHLYKEGHIRIISVRRDSDIELPCFTCISPEDGVEIEATYKPSAGAIGRSFRKVIDFFKEKLMQSRNERYDATKWTYDWDFANIGNQWKPLTSMHNKKGKIDRISEKIRRFLKRDEMKKSIGDEFELKLSNVDANNTGFYRCINQNPDDKKNLISSIYFVEVITDIREETIQSDIEEIPHTVDIQITENNEAQLKYLPMASSWSECSRCGNIMGEQVRSIQCIIQPIVSMVNLPNISNWINLFHSVPCSSTIVPLEYRRKEQMKYIQYRKCWTSCISKKEMNRTITSVDELGDKRIMDYIPAGEYIFGEILPRLLPPVIRKSYLMVESNPAVFTCHMSLDRNIGIFWHSVKSFNLSFSKIDTYFKKRVWFDESNRLIFSRLELSDEDQYYCYNSDGVLLAVFDLRVVENDKTKEAVESIKMILRFLAFVFIFVLIVGQLLK